MRSLTGSRPIWSPWPISPRLVGPNERDDIVQEALTRAWQRRATYDPHRGTLRPWLLAIVADRARRSRRRRPTAALWVGERDPAQPVADLDLEGALSHLPPRQRLAVELFYFVDLDVADTALVMGCAPGTVKSTLADARQRLRGRLEER